MDSLEAGCFQLVFTVGSSYEGPRVGRLAGYGIVFESRIHVSTQIPTHLRQSIDIVELFAALQTFKRFKVDKLAIGSDSSHVIIGAQRAICR